MTESTGETEAAATGRGRPRPDTTVTRDETVLKHLQASGPQSRAAIAVGTQLPGNEVYLSLYRLSRATPPKIVRNGAAWAALDENGNAIMAAAPEGVPATAE